MIYKLTKNLAKTIIKAISKAIRNAVISKPIIISLTYHKSQFINIFI